MFSEIKELREVVRSKTDREFLCEKTDRVFCKIKELRDLVSQKTEREEVCVKIDRVFVRKRIERLGEPKNRKRRKCV